MVVWLQSRRRISRRMEERRSTSRSPRGGGNARGHITTVAGRGGREGVGGGVTNGSGHDNGDGPGLWRGGGATTGAIAWVG